MINIFLKVCRKLSAKIAPFETFHKLLQQLFVVAQDSLTILTSSRSLCDPYGPCDLWADTLRPLLLRRGSLSP